MDDRHELNGTDTIAIMNEFLDMVSFLRSHHVTSYKNAMRFTCHYNLE